MDMDFEFSNQTDSSVELPFSSSSESGLREIYPFDFSLRSVFSFENDTLIVRRIVWNIGDTEMLFSLGEHTGSRLPVGNEKFEDCYLEFSTD